MNRPGFVDYVSVAIVIFVIAVPLCGNLFYFLFTGKYLDCWMKVQLSKSVGFDIAFVIVHILSLIILTVVLMNSIRIVW